jgi:hypothetical protein
LAAVWAGQFEFAHKATRMKMFLGTTVAEAINIVKRFNHLLLCEELKRIMRKVEN